MANSPLFTYQATTVRAQQIQIVVNPVLEAALRSAQPRSWQILILYIGLPLLCAGGFGMAGPQLAHALFVFLGKPSYLSFFIAAFDLVSKGAGLAFGVIWVKGILTVGTYDQTLRALVKAEATVTALRGTPPKDSAETGSLHDATLFLRDLMAAYYRAAQKQELGGIWAILAGPTEFHGARTGMRLLLLLAVAVLLAGTAMLMAQAIALPTQEIAALIGALLGLSVPVFRLGTLPESVQTRVTERYVSQLEARVNLNVPARDISWAAFCGWGLVALATCLAGVQLQQAEGVTAQVQRIRHYAQEITARPGAVPLSALLATQQVRGLQAWALYQQKEIPNSQDIYWSWGGNLSASECKPFGTRYTVCTTNGPIRNAMGQLGQAVPTATAQALWMQARPATTNSMEAPEATDDLVGFLCLLALMGALGLFCIFVSGQQVKTTDD